MSDLPSLTEEQRQRIEANKSSALQRLKAKRKNTEQQQPAKRSKWLKSYYEFNLSTMVDSKGGFIVEKTNDDDTKKNKSYRIEPYYPPSGDATENPKCKECQSMDLDSIFYNVFHINLCSSCKDKYPEKYSLITKTEAKEDYLLTDPELKDPDLLPHWSKPNPHKSSWNDMMLYVREMVETYAFQKWGSAEGLDAEYERRVAQKKEKQDKKFKEKLADMRRRTMTSTWERKRQEGPHKHDFSASERDDQGNIIQKCTDCGIVIESEEF
ncbi:DNA repair protein [Backusella circina FSU 941]|nr:DNA repair protein [Backusella circina FSU 941]